MVYGLGSLTFNQRDGVRISVGSLRGREFGSLGRAHKPEIARFNSGLRHSGVVQRQDASLLRKLSVFESPRRSHGDVAQSGERQPVKLGCVVQGVTPGE